MYVLLAVFVFVKNEVNVLATLRRPNIPARNVFTPIENVCVAVKPAICCAIPAGSYVEASISPPPDSGTFSHLLLVLLYDMISQFAGVAISTSVSQASVPDQPDITISPLPRSVFPFTVFMLVQDTKTA